MRKLVRAINWTAPLWWVWEGAVLAASVVGEAVLNLTMLAAGVRRVPR